MYFEIIQFNGQILPSYLYEPKSQGNKINKFERLKVDFEEQLGKDNIQNYRCLD